MSILLTRNCKLSSSSFACISPNVDSHATITSPHSETLLRSYSISSRRNLRDGGDEQSSMLVIKEMSAAPNNEVTESAKKAVIPESDTWLKRIKRSYKFLHLNYLFSLAFMMIYMFLGALLFLWLERASDQARKLHEYKFYIHERELFLEQLDNIYNVKVSQQRKVLLKKAIDYLHRQIGVSFSNRSEWSLTTALYYSGTVLTTIGYGDVACSTPSGRLMTVIYAIVGIPIMLITLRDLGNFLYKTMINAIRLMRFTSNIDDEFNEDLIKENDEKMIKANDMVLSRPNPPVRIPVLLAIGTTFGWIFICAGLFKIWERDWTYAESCYFMFISLSTIGLGDLSVRRRDLMIMCFVFVIIGLAMVSMCISVIQKALEDFYINVFLKLLLEYQSKLSQGNGAVEASVGMMQMWDNNKKAKYLMSFLSKNRRASVLTKVQKDAEAHGIEVPLIFSNIDEESGMPKLFANEVNEETAAAIVEETIQQHVENVELNAPPMKSSTDLSLPKTVFYEMGVQTHLLSF
ncbi:Ion channel family protein [Acanthocheilonema viteae]